jgi:pilus assembly protein CpaD
MRKKGTTVMRNKTLLTVALPAALAALALSGCKNSGAEMDDVYAPIATYERFPIEVKKGAVTMEIPAGRNLSPANQDKLTRFAQMAHSNRASSVIVSRPAGSAHGFDVANQAEAILIKGGVPSDAIISDSHGGGSVVVSYTRSYAVTQACGDWSEDLAVTGDNQPYENFGCATQHNIAAMVANPEDLLLPETMTPSDVARRNRVFEDYRTPKSTATPAEDQSDATISDIAK